MALFGDIFFIYDSCPLGNLRIIRLSHIKSGQFCAYALINVKAGFKVQCQVRDGEKDRVGKRQSEIEREKNATVIHRK